MPSRALGIFALCAVVLAAISFSAVDVAIGGTTGCGAESCDPALSGGALTCAIIGTLALLASIPAAVAWFVDAVRHEHPDAELPHVALAALRPVSVADLEEDE